MPVYKLRIPVPDSALDSFLNKAEMGKQLRAKGSYYIDLGTFNGTEVEANEFQQACAAQAAKDLKSPPPLVAGFKSPVAVAGTLSSQISTDARVETYLTALETAHGSKFKRNSNFANVALGHNLPDPLSAPDFANLVVNQNPKNNFALSTIELNEIDAANSNNPVIKPAVNNSIVITPAPSVTSTIPAGPLSTKNLLDPVCMDAMKKFLREELSNSQLKESTGDKGKQYSFSACGSDIQIKSNGIFTKQLNAQSAEMMVKLYLKAQFAPGGVPERNKMGQVKVDFVGNAEQKKMLQDAWNKLGPIPSAAPDDTKTTGSSFTIRPS